MATISRSIPAPATTPTHLWIVGGLSLLWNSFGAFDYLMTQLQAEFYMSQFTEEQLAYFYGFPAWAAAGWAFGVWGAFLGSILLLMRSKWAVWSFGLSLAGLAVSSIYTLGISNGMELMGGVAMYMSAAIWIVAIALFFYARAQKNHGVLE